MSPWLNALVLRHYVYLSHPANPIDAKGVQGVMERFGGL